jgi:hypothetical protein
MKRTVYIELPPEDPNYRCGKYYGLLEKAMYCARDAPQILQEVVAEVMMRSGFKASLHHPSIYFHPERDIRVIAHVDDFLRAGDEVQMDWLYKELSLEYDLKVQKVSGDSRRNQEAKFLNRTIRVTDEGIQIMGGEKHAQILLREWGMENCKGLDNPVGAPVKDVLEERIPMDPDDAWKYRRGTVRVNYMAQDRPDLGVAAKMLSQFMADPQMGDEVPLKRVIWYLKSFPECISNLYFQDAKHPLVIMSDSDWAGDEETRKSTSGGLVRYCGHLISHWCKTQATVALSSGEAELNAIVKGCSEGIGVYELLRDLGCNPRIFSSETDSSAARGTVLRTGVGKMKHLSTKQLWVQGAIRIYGIDFVKIPRGINSADFLTHGCTTADFNNHLERLFLNRPRPENA